MGKIISYNKKKVFMYEHGKIYIFYLSETDSIVLCESYLFGNRGVNFWFKEESGMPYARVEFTDLNFFGDYIGDNVYLGEL